MRAGERQMVNQDCGQYIVTAIGDSEKVNRMNRFIPSAAKSSLFTLANGVQQVRHRGEATRRCGICHLTFRLMLSSLSHSYPCLHNRPGRFLNAQIDGVD